jgi:MoaA/NifB/PqqE/SkfB family radical SAM enzyme
MKNKLRKSLDLTKGIIDYNFLHYFKPLSPTGLQVNVTYHCNSRCEMCKIWEMKPKNEMEYKEWRRAMTDPIFRSIERLTIAGGEPVLHPDLVKLISLFIKSMPRLQFLVLVTNGFLPKKTVSITKSIAKLTEKKGINFTVSISLDGVGAINDDTRGIPGAFEKTSSTILALRKLQERYNFWLNVAAVVYRKNIRHLKELKEWCQEINIPLDYQLIGFHETYVQNIKEKNKLDFRKADEVFLFSLLEELSKSSFQRDLRAWFRSYYWKDMLALYQGGNRTTPCPFVFDTFVIDSLGDVYYCLSERRIGNFRKGKTISEIYYDSQNLAFRKNLTKTACLKCNSACNVASAIAKDFKRFVWFFCTGRLY